MILSLIIFAAALFIDGATDCANSVTGAVSSGSMTLKGASVMSALLSFCGCFFFCLFFPFVAKNTSSAVTFTQETAPTAVIASLFCVALWSGIAWLFSLPTSEGHALISASAGAALALGGRIHVLRILFLIISVVPTAIFAALLSVFISKLMKKARSPSLKIPIILSAALSSLFHGAQDGQKFIALAISASMLRKENTFSMILMLALFMAAGTLFGKRIIKKMGGEMAVADEKAAISADIGSALSLALLTWAGIPASTTHIRMTSLTAATSAAGGKTSRAAFLLLVGAWCATFPACFSLSFLLSKLFFIISL